MAGFFDYAALSARVYRNVRGEQNINPLPADWDEIAYTSGGLFDAFTAGAYKNGNDIVIAFKGTDIAFNSLSSAANTVDDIASDIALGAGLGSTQLFQAETGSGVNSLLLTKLGWIPGRLGGQFFIIDKAGVDSSSKCTT